MRTIFDVQKRAQLAERLRRMTPESSPRWGSMTSGHVLAHLHDALLMALGELPVVITRSRLAWPPVKKLIIHVLPFPKGVPTSPELLGRSATDFPAEIAAIAALLDLCADPAQALAAEHPAFGRLSRTDWGVLIYRHTDHHLRQFGV